MRIRFAFAAALGLASCDMIVVSALNLVTTTEFSVQGDTLLMSGEINSKTPEQFEAIIAENPNINTLIEVDVPGSLDDEAMIELAYLVRELELDTHLTSDSEIHSGGVDLFLAGVTRTIESGAIIGVHSWSDGVKDATDYPRGSPEHEANRKYIEDMLGLDDFYWFTIYAAAASDNHIMTVDEINQYGLATR